MNDRFAQLWTSWDARIGRGESRTSILADAKDEDLVELLSGESGKDRKFDRDVIGTEVLNRMHRRNTTLPNGAEAVRVAAQSAQHAAQAGQAAIHASEALLHAAGEHELGQAVSESAYESLDLTKAAFEAAEDHAADVQVGLAQSRLGAEVLADQKWRVEQATHAASEAAHRGSDITDDLERHMTSIGKGDEGRATAEAGKAILKAADAADASRAEAP